LGKQAKYWGIAGVAAVAALAYGYFRLAPLMPADVQTEAVSSASPDRVALGSPALPNLNDTPEAEIAAEPEAPPPQFAKPAQVAIAALPEARVKGAPEVASGLEASLQAPNTEDNSGQRLYPDSNVVKTAAPEAVPPPNQVLPAPALAGSPALGTAPDAEFGPSGTPAKETTPQLGMASLPLTLAQVLPPGQTPAPNQTAPSFDLVRVAPDGSAVIAGRAAPGANVQVFSGTIPVAEAKASARGEFVVFLNAPSETTLDLQIPAAPEGAALVVSQEDIIILPAAPEAADITPIVVRRTPDSVQIVQPSGPAIPANISLDLVSYADSGAVQLAGRGQPGNVARIYADGRLAGEATIAQGGNWEVEIGDIAEGRYILRVDEITPAGEVVSRTESPFQRQFPEADMPESFSQGAKIIVQPGNTLWLMATEAYGNGGAYSQIYSANLDSIRDPDLIYPGQIFSIPRIEE